MRICSETHLISWYNKEFAGIQARREEKRKKRKKKKKKMMKTCDYVSNDVERFLEPFMRSVRISG